MILVFLGTQLYPVVRLESKIIEWAKESPKEEIIYQSVDPSVGSRFSTIDNIKSVRMIDDVDTVIRSASHILTHCGTGNIYRCFKNNVKPHVFWRNKVYGEHIDQHQYQLFQDLLSNNLIFEVDLSKKLRFQDYVKDRNLLPNKVFDGQLCEHLISQYL